MTQSGACQEQSQARSGSEWVTAQVLVCGGSRLQGYWSPSQGTVRLRELMHRTGAVLAAASGAAAARRLGPAGAGDITRFSPRIDRIFPGEAFSEFRSR